MVYFECPRCGYRSLRKADFLRHLRRKYPCRTKLQDVPIEEIIRKHFNYKTKFESVAWMKILKKLNHFEPERTILNPNEPLPLSPSKTARPKNSLRGSVSMKRYGCRGCKKKFTTNSHMRRHEKKCPKKKHLDELEDLDQQVALKERELRLVKVHQHSCTNNITNNTQIINNTNVTVNILPYEHTDVSHLTDRDYQIAFNRAAMCVPQILEKVHFDPKQPQNHNVYISSMNNKYIKLHNGERWNLRDREETIGDLFADAEYMLENKLETWQEEADPKSERATKKFEIYLKVKEKAAMYNKIKQELKLLLFNNRNLVTE